MASYQYVYVMKRLTKIYPGSREVLTDITLAFLPGAKIGVIGSNGAGKSTLLRIMAGLEEDYNGEAWIADGATAGYLPQEPQLDLNKTVEENVLEGLASIKAVVDRFEAVSEKLGEVEDVDEMTALIDEQAALAIFRDHGDHGVDHLRIATLAGRDVHGIELIIGEGAHGTVGAAARMRHAQSLQHGPHPPRQGPVMEANKVSPPKGGSSWAYRQEALGGAARKLKSVCQVPPKTISVRSSASLMTR